MPQSPIKAVFTATLVGLCAACVRLPDAIAPATPADFQAAMPSVAPAASLAPGAPTPPPADPFAGDASTNVDTPTKFDPQLTWTLGSTAPTDRPALTIAIYQTKNELALRDTRSVVENARFDFSHLTVGQVLGNGQMTIGTPPKLTLDVTMAVTDTNQSDHAILSVKASSPFAKLYVADLELAQLPNALAIVTLGNAARSSEKNGVFTTQASVRLTLSLLPGYFQLPASPGPMRTRTVITSEPDQTNHVTGQRVIWNRFDIH